MRIPLLMFGLGLAAAVGVVFPSHAQVPAATTAAFRPPAKLRFRRGRWAIPFATAQSSQANPDLRQGLRRRRAASQLHDCHLNGGTTAYASPWVGIWGVFPEDLSQPQRQGQCITGPRQRLLPTLDERQAAARRRGRNARDSELHVVAVERRAYRCGRGRARIFSASSCPIRRSLTRFVARNSMPRNAALATVPKGKV